MTMSKASPSIPTSSPSWSPSLAPTEAPTIAAAVQQGRTIWTFWEGPMCEVVSRCLESMRMHNPTRPIVVLNNATIPLYLGKGDFPLFHGQPGRPEDFEKVQYLADWIRVRLLEKYGGIWLDASCFQTAPVESWMSEDSSKITMFPMHANPNIHGNWAMAAPRSHPFVVEFRKELAAVFNETGSGQLPVQYIERQFEQYPSLKERWYNPRPPPLPYLWVYVVLQVVLERNPQLHDTIYLRPSIDGPMYRRYLCNVVLGENNPVQVSINTADHLAREPLMEQSHDRFFIKLVGHDRAPVASLLERGEYHPESALAVISRINPRPIVFGRDLHRLRQNPDHEQVLQEEAQVVLMSFLDVLGQTTAWSSLRSSNRAINETLASTVL